MKKFVVLLMALCLLGTCALAEVAEVNWADVQPVVEESGVEGEFYTLNACEVMLWVPTVFQPIDVPEDAEVKDIVACFTNEAGDAGINVVYTNVNGATIEEYAAALSEEGAENIEVEIINGLKAVEYTLSENDTLNIAFVSDTGYLLEFTMTPISEEGAIETWAMVAASIQPAA